MLVRSGTTFGRVRTTFGRVSTTFGLGLALVLAACSGATSEPMNSTGDDGPVEVPPWACVPGETQPCACPDELEGLRICNADGSAFGECDCSPGAVSQGPLATGTETGTGSGSGTGMATDATDTGTMTTMGPGTTTDPDPTTDGGGSSSGPGGSSSGSTG